MANRREPHYAGANKRGTLAVRGVGILQAHGDTVPTDGVEGYAKGCIFQNTAGTTVSTMLYVNIGTKTSADFDPLTG